MIFRRSLVSEFANSAGGVFTVLFSIVLTVGLVQILGRAVGGRIDSTTVFEIVAYSSLTNLPPLLTLSLFIAVLMVLMRSWQDSEMVVWFSSGGISLLAWIRPMLRFSLPVVLLISVLSLSVTPWAKGQIERASQQFEQRDDVNRIAPGRFIETMGGQRVFFIEDVDRKGTHVSNIFMSEKNNGREIIVRARSGDIRVTALGDRYIVLHDGRRYETSAQGDSAWRVIEFKNYEIRIDTKADEVYASRDVDEIPIDKLWQLDTPAADAQLLWRFSWPLAALNLAFLAIPLSFVNPRAGRSMSLVIAVLVFILYLNGISVMRTWVKTEDINWILGLVLLNGSIAVLSAALFVRRGWMLRWLPVWLVELPYKLLSGRAK